VSRYTTALAAAILLAACADSPVEPARTGEAAGAPRAALALVDDPGLAPGTIIDFEDLLGAGSMFAFVASHSEDGFTVADPANSAVGAFGAPQPANTSFYQGSMALVNNTPGGVTRLTKEDGGTFTAASIDVAELRATDLTPREVRFTGTRPDGSTLTATFTTDGVAGFQTFTFAGFTGLASLSWVQAAPFHQFDNITLDPPADPDPGPGPEPAPLTKGDCMGGGWKEHGFKNQGQCVRFVETGQDSR